ncbi:MAG TPA: PaaI family thioesterase [Frankiaceae bacterium]|nr:PaaI family thioesterase [Frankiaceae bacterium]
MELPEGVVGFDKLLGVEYLEASGDRVVLTCDVRPDLHQPYGILHGGVHCALVESAASIGGAMWFGDRGNVVGVANHTNFLRATREGRLTVTAEPVQRGRTQQLWRVTVTDDNDRTLASGEVRLANITSSEVLGGR